VYVCATVHVYYFTMITMTLLGTVNGPSALPQKLTDIGGY